MDDVKYGRTKEEIDNADEFFKKLDELKKEFANDFDFVGILWAFSFGVISTFSVEDKKLAMIGLQNYIKVAMLNDIDVLTEMIYHERITKH